MEKIPVKEKTLCVMAQELSDSNTGLTLWRREGRKEGRKVGCEVLHCNAILKKMAARPTGDP